MHIALAVFSKNEADRIISEVTGLLPGNKGFNVEFNRRFQAAYPGGFVERDFELDEPMPVRRSHLEGGFRSGENDVT